MVNDGISVADALALRNSGDSNGFGSGFGDNGAWWIIILILLFGAGGWGRGVGYGGSSPESMPASMQGLSDAFNFSSIDSALRGISNGICDGFYAQNQAINGVLSALQNCCCQTQLGMCQGFGDVTRSISDLGYQIGNGFCGISKTILESDFHTQSGFNNIATLIAQNGCDTRNLIQSTTRDIIDSNNAGVRSILDFLTQDKIDALRSENQTLKFQASQSAQNAYIAANQEAQTAELIRRLGRDCPVPAYVVPNPNCCYPQAQVSFNSGCGCGCGCG